MGDIKIDMRPKKMGLQVINIGLKLLRLTENVNG